MIGSTISHYKILEKLGEGGMGVVYKAEDTILQRPVALKLLATNAVLGEEERARFVREAQAAAGLSHHHIATVYEFGEFEGRGFLAMEYVEGHNLAHRIKQSLLPLDEFFPICLAIAEGLNQAHGKGIIHRDIKPDNIMLAPGGVVKIMDFGIAEMKGRARITKTGGTVGTVFYMSPEQARGDEVDHRTDIWSLGVLMYEALTGKLPFLSDYESAVLYLILHEPPVPISKYRNDIPASLQAAILRCLSKHPDERFENAAALSEELKSIRDNLTAAGKAVTAGKGTGEQRVFETEKRPVTILFATILESHDGGETDPELRLAALNECFKGLISIVERYEGMTDRIVGEKLMAVFGAPIAHENDAERAVRCAREMKSYFDRITSLEIAGRPGSMKLSIALHSGVVIAGTVEGSYSITGESINITAGIAEAAGAGAILLSEDVLKQVSGIAEMGDSHQVAIKGKTKPVAVQDLRSIRAEAEPGQRAVGRGAFVGREKELQKMKESLRKVLSKEEYRLFLRGEAGVGKSRLKMEIVVNAQKAGLSVYEGKCSSFEINTPYYLWNTLLKSLFHIGHETTEQEVRTRLHETLQILSLGEEEPYLATLLSLRYEEILLEVDELRKRRIFEAARKLLQAFARRRPVLLVFEDLHWIDRFSQDLLQFVFSGVVGSAMILCTYRPEYTKASAVSASGELFDLDRLAPDQARQLMRLRLNAEEVPTQLEKLIEQRAEGNPFFIEEIIKTLIDRKIVAVKRGKVEVLSENLEAVVPESLQAVILARIDQLGEKIRDVLLGASVIGREFSRPVLEHVVHPKTDIIAGLRKLESLELILERQDAHELEYLFKHYLIQEVAYNTILGNRRKKLHGLIAETIEKLYSERLKEYYELLAFHYEKAENWSKAAEYLSRAGQKASEIFSKDESEGFQSRKEDAIAKLYESAGERRIGWIILALLTAATAIPVAVVMLLVPYWIVSLYVALPSYIRFELWGSEFLGYTALFAYLSFLSLGYPWAGLVFTFLGIIPAFKGSPKLFDLLDDQIRVVFGSGKVISIHFSEIERMAFRDRKTRRQWKYRLIDPLWRVYDYSGLNARSWLKGVVMNPLPPFSFGFGSRLGEIHLIRKSGHRGLRLILPWLNTYGKSKDVNLTPSDPHGFYEQLTTAYKKWSSPARTISAVKGGGA